MAQSSSEIKARYRERHREQLRAKGRAYAARKRRDAGMPALGSPESRENRSRARKAKGAEHGHWKGDAVGYFALHVWLARHKPPSRQCGHCRRVHPATQIANVSGEYRRDAGDYVELCPRCHNHFDMTPARRLRRVKAWAFLLWDEHLSNAEIGRRVGMTRESVRRLRKELSGHR